MHTEKIKTGICATDILAIIFLLLGGVFTAIAVVFELNLPALRAHSTGNAALLPVVFGAVGVALLAPGVVFAVVSVRKRSAVRRAVEGGYYIMANVADIRPNFSIQVNGQCPYVLECHYQDPATGALHVFKSRNLFFYPAELENRQLRVYVDRANWDHYYVDVDGLTPGAVLH